MEPKRSYILVGFIALLLTFSLTAFAQFEEQGLEVGLGLGTAIGLNESEDHPLKPQVRAFLNSYCYDHLVGEFGIG